MKINKISIAMIAASLLAISPAVYAQTTNNAGGGAAAGGGGRARGGMSVDAQMDRIDKAVTLTDAQKPKVKAALEDQSKAMQEARSGDATERRTKYQAAHDDFNKKLKDILTPEQYTKYEALPTPNRRGGAGGGGA